MIGCAAYVISCKESDWPKFLPTSSGRAAIEFHVALEGSELAIPNPRQFPPLDGFVDCLRDVREYAGDIAESGRRVEAITRYGRRK